MKKALKDVDSYIQAVPKDMRAKLSQLRSIIKSIAPKTEESISYGMPYYAYKGRLAYFQLSKEHIGLYIPTPTMEEHKNELGDYWQFYLKRSGQLRLNLKFKQHDGNLSLLIWSDKVAFVRFGEKMQVFGFKNKELHDLYQKLWNNY